MSEILSMEERYAELLIEVRDNVDSVEPLKHKAAQKDRANTIKVTMDAARALAAASHIPYCVQCKRQGTCEGRTRIEHLGQLPSSEATPR